MKSKEAAYFSLGKIQEMALPAATVWLLSTCMEAKGKQDLWLRQKPEVLRALREQAMIQSAESSNRIEGITVKKDRLRQIVLGQSNPRDRSEEEIVGYRKALNWIFSRKTKTDLVPEIVLHLHQLCQGGFSGDAGQWKRKDNEIVELLPNGERRVRFRPLSAGETPEAMSRLCHLYNELDQQDRLPKLIVISTCVFDFLCVHPFRDGNGRISRLLTTFLFAQNQFQVGRYVSLERLVEDTKEDYYAILEKCSLGWHEGRNEVVPWHNYLLSILKTAYSEFASRVELAGRDLGKSEIVKQVIEQQLAPFSLAEIKAQCPSASTQLVKKILYQMKRDRRIHLMGRGRGALWKKAKIE